MSRAYLKAVLKEYIKREEYKKAIKQSFFEHFEICQGSKLRRGFVNATICHDLKLVISNKTQIDVKRVLYELGVLPMASNGRMYYKHVRARENVK